MPVATVVIPTKNRQDMLATTLRSVLGQRDVDLQVVIVDDGSSTEVAQHLDELAGAAPAVEVVHLPGSQGLPSARNAGIDRASTDWVAFCDDDDLWSPDKLALQLDALARKPSARWCLPGSIGFDERLRIVGHARPVVGTDLYERLLAANVVPGGGSGVLASTALVRELGGFRTDLGFGEDWEMWMRMAGSAPAAAVDRPLVAYRVWHGAMSSTVNIEEAFRLIDRVHAEERARLGVEAKPIGIELRRATDDAWAGRRRGSARRFLRLAAMQRNPKKVVVAAMALVAPHRTYQRLTARSASAVPEEWIREVAEWLPDLLGVAPSAVGGA